ncbi:hypothetical protein RN001_005443 [Aquatica leii]|uniref:Uncharacterized protein n=1 Tax=Aquatica leii TaxID=1421715 RepID=A0AAN7Q0E4_9COLE|nr:hypothetical protein RN001_005443 [Aquatica leii]
MKQALTGNHLPSVVSKFLHNSVYHKYIWFFKLEQLDKELQMAIDYIKTLMIQMDEQSSNNNGKTVSQSRSQKCIKETATVNTENKNFSLPGYFVDECTKKQPKETNKIRLKSLNHIYDEPNYYYGDKLFSKGLLLSRPPANCYKNTEIKTNKLIFDGLEKIDFIKTKVDSQTKLKGTSKNIDEIIALLNLKCNTPLSRVKKLDVPTSDKRKRNTSFKHENVLQINTVPMIPNSTQTSFPFSIQAECTVKPNLNSTIKSQSYEIAQCVALNHTKSEQNYTSIQTQTQPIYFDFSSQTTKDSLKQNNITDTSLTHQAYNDEDINTALLQRLDTGLQTSFVVLSKSEKTLRDTQQVPRRRKMTSQKAKKNEKICLYQVIDDPTTKECNFECNQIRLKQSPKKVKFIQQTELHKQDKLHEKPVRDRNYIHLLSLSSDTAIQRNNTISEKHMKPQKEYTKLAPYKLPINRRTYDCDSFRNNPMENMYYVENFATPINIKRKSKLKKTNECVNIEVSEIYDEVEENAQTDVFQNIEENKSQINVELENDGQIDTPTFQNIEEINPQINAEMEKGLPIAPNKDNEAGNNPDAQQQTPTKNIDVFMNIPTPFKKSLF